MKRLYILFVVLAVILNGCIILPDHDRGEHRGYEHRDDRGDHDDDRNRGRDHEHHNGGDHDDYHH